MKEKVILLIGLLIVCSFSQTQSLIDFIKTTKLPANCLTVDKDNSCTSCIDGFDVDKGSCVKINVQAEDFAPTAAYVPCGKN